MLSMRIAVLSMLSIVVFTGPSSAEETIMAKPPLYFREDWKETPAETPVTQDHVNNDDLSLDLYGPGMDMIKKSHHDTPPDDPFYIWSGQCEGNWAVVLTKRNSLVDLTNGCIGWRTKNFNRVLYVVVGLADGGWLVTSRGTGETPDWHEYSIDLTGMRWRILDISSVTAGDMVDNPDLTRIRSIGFTDLEPGGQSDACSRLDWIEVYGR